MPLGNRIVKALLASPLHRLLSGSTDVIRYTGATSGRVFSTPTQYARLEDGIVIMSGRAETKQWWRNFIEERDIDVLIEGHWTAMRGQARRGSVEPEDTERLLDAYLKRFPRVARTLSTDPAERVRAAVLVECHPR